MHSTPETYLHVSISRQEVHLLRGGLLWSAPVSTASLGVGEEVGSYKTPRGWFQICEKIGMDSPLGSIFKSRKPTGDQWSPDFPQSSEDLILSRILWLEGLEEQNQNTKERYIYFHGTNHENKIGRPESHGCIRLKNSDVIHLFDQIEVGTKVKIE